MFPIVTIVTQTCEAAQTRASRARRVVAAAAAELVDANAAIEAKADDRRRGERRARVDAPLAVCAVCARRAHANRLFIIIVVVVVCTHAAILANAVDAAASAIAGRAIEIETRRRRRQSRRNRPQLDLATTTGAIVASTPAIIGAMLVYALVALVVRANERAAFALIFVRLAIISAVAAVALASIAGRLVYAAAARVARRGVERVGAKVELKSFALSAYKPKTLIFASINFLCLQF